STRSIRPSTTRTRYGVAPLVTRNVPLQKRPRRTRSALPFTRSGRRSNIGAMIADDRAHGSRLHARARDDALLALVLLPARERAASRARAARWRGAPLHQSSEQLHRLARGGRRRAAQGALPRHGRALSQRAPRPLLARDG